jgi:hypothetical protein
MLNLVGDCGSNIEGFVNVHDLVEYSKTFPSVVYKEIFRSACGRMEKVKTLSVRLGVVLLSFWILFVFSEIPAEGKNWKLYHISEKEFYFYDAESVMKTKNVLKVSEKSVVREIKPCNLAEALKEIVELDKGSPLEMTDESRKKAIATRTLQETRRLYEIRCSKKMYRIATGMEYDKEETLIDGILSSSWDSLNPDSIIEKLYKAVCP